MLPTLKSKRFVRRYSRFYEQFLREWRIRLLSFKALSVGVIVVICRRKGRRDLGVQFSVSKVSMNSNRVTIIASVFAAFVFSPRHFPQRHTRVTTALTCFVAGKAPLTVRRIRQNASIPIRKSVRNECFCRCYQNAFIARFFLKITDRTTLGTILLK